VPIATYWGFRFDMLGLWIRSGSVEKLNAAAGEPHPAGPKKPVVKKK
jgi:hypothetical protein